jgi:transcriptional regulator with XRE-family HTH domain
MENRIGSERVRMKMTQSDLAKQLGVSSKAISQWETGQSACPAKRLVSLASIFDCSIDWLLGLTDDRRAR